MFSQEQIFNAMQQLELPEQIAAIEAFIDENGISEKSADVISMFMMSMMMDLDGGTYPTELVQQTEKIIAAVREFNQKRFGT